MNLSSMLPRWLCFSENDWLRLNVENLQRVCRNADAARRSHDAQLREDFGIYYDAACDLYRKYPEV